MLFIFAAPSLVNKRGYNKIENELVCIAEFIACYFVSSVLFQCHQALKKKKILQIYSNMHI